MDQCSYCKTYHHEQHVCDEYIEAIAKGKTWCNKCWFHTFSKEHDCTKCGLSKGSWDN